MYIAYLCDVCVRDDMTLTHMQACMGYEVSQSVHNIHDSTAYMSNMDEAIISMVRQMDINHTLNHLIFI